MHLCVASLIECCRNLVLSSSNSSGASLAQQFSFGNYVLNASGIMSPNVYKKLNDRYQHYLFKLEIQSDLSFWAVGPQVGVNYLYLVHLDGNQRCPEYLAPNTWLYQNPTEQNWARDSTISLTCL